MAPAVGDLDPFHDMKYSVSCTHFSLGIGTGIVKELAKRGASEAFTYVSSTKAQDVLRELQSSGTKAIAIQADCADAVASSKWVVEEVAASFGKIDIIVNNAGLGEDHSLFDVTQERFDRVFHINLLFPLLLVKESVPYLQQKARIVNVGSISGRIGKHSEQHHGLGDPDKEKYSIPGSHHVCSIKSRNRQRDEINGLRVG